MDKEIKFDDNFMDSEDVIKVDKKQKIFLNNGKRDLIFDTKTINQKNYPGICFYEFRKFEECQNEINKNLTKNIICEKNSDILISCLKNNGVFIIE